MGGVTRASLNKQPHEVASMFDDVAERYDLTNDVLSLGQDRVWRKEVARAVDARPAQKILDLAAGTATSSLPFARTGAYVVPCDFSLGMLQVGKRKHTWLPFTAGDATKLPFKDDTFDAVTISFGLRNVQDTDTALREMYRVTKPGGRVVICEFSHPTWAPFRTVYTEYLMRALPPVARAVSSNPDAYVYLAESIRAWPDQPALAERLQKAGWSKVAWRNLTGGIVALHRGRQGGRPSGPSSCPAAWPPHESPIRSPTGAARTGCQHAVAPRRPEPQWVTATAYGSPARPVRAAGRRSAAAAGAARARRRLRRPHPGRGRTTRRPSSPAAPRHRAAGTGVRRSRRRPGGSPCRSGALTNRPCAWAVSRASTAIRPTRRGTRTSGVLGVMRTDVTPSGTGRVTPAPHRPEVPGVFL